MAPDDWSAAGLAADAVDIFAGAGPTAEPEDLSVGRTADFSICSGTGLGTFCGGVASLGARFSSSAGFAAQHHIESFDLRAPAGFRLEPTYCLR